MWHRIEIYLITKFETELKYIWLKYVTQNWNIFDNKIWNRIEIYLIKIFDAELKLEECPKWLALREVLDEIEEDIATSSIDLGSVRVLVAAQDDRTCSQLSQVRQGSHHCWLYFLFRARIKHLPHISEYLYASDSAIDLFYRLSVDWSSLISHWFDWFDLLS